MAEKGGSVIESGVAVIHQGETIMTKQGTGTLEQMLTSGKGAMAGADAGGLHNDFRGANFGAGLTEGMVDTFMNNVFRKARLAGMIPKHA